MRLKYLPGGCLVRPDRERSISRRASASIEYIQSYRGTSDTLDASLERIRATAQRLSIELDAIRFDAEDEPGAF
jgi:hypothetical protein